MKTALITGGNRGIGRAIAEGLMEDHRVVIGVRDLEAGKAAAREIGCEVITLDLMKPDSFEAAVRVGVDRANATLRNVTSAWVKEQRVAVQDGKIAHYQVNLMVTFILED